MDYYTLDETSEILGLTKELLTFYVEVYEQNLETICSPDLKELYFTSLDLETLKQIHDMSDLLQMTTTEVSNSLNRLQTPCEIREKNDPASKEAQDLVNLAIKTQNIPQTPFENKLVHLVKVQKKMSVGLNQCYKEVVALTSRVNSLETLLETERTLHQAALKKLKELGTQIFKMKAHRVKTEEALEKMNNRLQELEEKWVYPRNNGFTQEPQLVRVGKVSTVEPVYNLNHSINSTGVPLFDSSQLEGLEAWIQKLEKEGKN